MICRDTIPGTRVAPTAYPKRGSSAGAEAAAAGDIVVVTVPLRAYRDVPAEPLAGKVVIDTNNFDSIGFDTVDAGPLAENWRAQRDTPVYVTPYGAFGVLPGTPASAQVVRAALAAAKPTAA